MPFPYTFSFPFPNGPVGPSTQFPKGPAGGQFVRGVKFANVPGGRADMIFYPGSGRVAHVNTVETVIQKPASIEYDGRYSGVIKFRFRSYRDFPVPSSVRGS